MLLGRKSRESAKEDQTSIRKKDQKKPPTTLPQRFPKITVLAVNTSSPAEAGMYLRGWPCSESFSRGCLASDAAGTVLCASTQAADTHTVVRHVIFIKLLSDKHKKSTQPTTNPPKNCFSPEDCPWISRICCRWSLCREALVWRRCFTSFSALLL